MLDGAALPTNPVLVQETSPAPTPQDILEEVSRLADLQVGIKTPLIILRDQFPERLGIYFDLKLGGDFPERLGIYLDLKLGSDPQDPGPEFPFSTDGNDSGTMGLPPAPGGLLGTTAIGDDYPATTAGLGRRP